MNYKRGIWDNADANSLRWDALKKRMSARGLEMPSARVPAESKAKVAKTKAPKAANTTKKPRGKKGKEAAEAAEAIANGEGEDSTGEGGEEAQEAQENSGEEVAEDESA